MNFYRLLFILIVSISSCTHQDPQKLNTEPIPSSTDTTKNDVVSPKPKMHSTSETLPSLVIPEAATWADEQIMTYLHANSERLTEVDGYPVSYLKETTTRNGRQFAVARIGHSFEDRYITDQWIFIDSVSKEIYEFDIINDSLILWKNNYSETQSILKETEPTDVIK